MALDLAPCNINVNSVASGFTYTGMTKGSFDNEEIREQSEKLIPEGRIGWRISYKKIAGTYFRTDGKK